VFASTGWSAVVPFGFGTNPPSRPRAPILPFPHAPRTVWMNLHRRRRDDAGPEVIPLRCASSFSRTMDSNQTSRTILGHETRLRILSPPGRRPFSVGGGDRGGAVGRRSGVPFLTGQKGDGKSRRTRRAAADGAALRRGRESEGPEGSSRGLTPSGRSNSDSRGGAEGHTLAVPLCIAPPSESPHRERSGPTSSG